MRSRIKGLAENDWSWQWTTWLRLSSFCMAFTRFADLVLVGIPRETLHHQVTPFTYPVLHRCNQLPTYEGHPDDTRLDFYVWFRFIQLKINPHWQAAELLANIIFILTASQPKYCATCHHKWKRKSQHVLRSRHNRKVSLSILNNDDTPLWLIVGRLDLPQRCRADDPSSLDLNVIDNKPSFSDFFSLLMKKVLELRRKGVSTTMTVKATNVSVQWQQRFKTSNHL